MSSPVDVSWLRACAQECRQYSQQSERRARSFWSLIFWDRQFWKKSAADWRELADDRDKLTDELEEAATLQMRKEALVTSEKQKAVYHIIEAVLCEDDGQQYADIHHIPTDTLEGVYANMAQHGMTPSSVTVILGYKVTLDPKRFEAHYEEVRRRIAEEGKAARRAQYECLKLEFEGEG